MKNKLLKYYLLFLSILITFNNSYAQEYSALNPKKLLSQYIIKTWSVENNAPIDEIVDIIQTKDNYIWYGGFDGLVRFDGVDFKLFNTTNTPELSVNVIKKLYQDRTGKLWIGTQQGLLYYKDYRFYRNSALDELNKESIESILLDSKNNLWIGTSSNGLYRLTNGTLYKITELPFINKSIVSIIFEDTNNVIWIASENGDLATFHNNIYTQLDKPPTNGIFSMYENSDGKKYFATGNGVYTLKNKLIAKYSKIKLTNIKQVIVDNYGDFWLATQNGLFRYSSKTDKLDSLTINNGLLNNILFKISFDNEGNLWGATYRKGIFQLTDGKFTCYSKTEGTQSNMITAVIELSKNEYYLGNENGKINILKNGKIYNLNENIPLPNSRLKHLFKDSKDNIWVSTYGGLLKISNNGHILYNTKSGFADNYVRLVFEDSKNNIWIGTRRTGIHKLNKDNSYITLNELNGMSSNFIMNIIETKSGDLVVGTSMGINIIRNNKVIKQYTAKNGLSSNFSFNIYEDRYSNLWVCSNSGLCRIKNGKFVNFSSKNGFPANSVFDILIDNYGYFWLPSANGIIKVSSKELNNFADGKTTKFKYKIFDKKDGLKNNKCIGATKSLKSNDNRMWFLTSSGVAMINPQDTLTKENKLKIIIEEIKTDQTIFYPKDKVIIPYDNKRLTIKFTAFNYKLSENIQFRYKLEPYEKEWVENSNIRNIQYTNVHSGNNLFVLSAKIDGKWSNNITSIKIKVLSPFYRTWWFILIIILGSLFFIYTIFKLRIKRIEIQKRKLEKIVEQRTIEVKEKNRELKKLSIVASKTDNSVLILDYDGNIEWINDGFTRLFGYTFSEFIKKTNGNLFKNTNIKEYKTVIDNCKKTKKSVNYSTLVPAKDSSSVWVQSTITPILDENNDIIKFISIDSDISKLKEAENSILQKNEEIRLQTEQLLETNTILEAKKDEIVYQNENIRASIRYALTIQKAILPSLNIINRDYETFIIYKPKDIVSGDFYWFANVINNNKHYTFVVVSDCTGHGVPGAFMSMIGSRLLSEIIVEKQIIDPKKVLEIMDEKIKTILNQKKSDNDDGMDVCLCRIENSNNEQKELIFAGAKRPLFIFKKSVGEVVRIKGSRKPVGGKYFRKVSYNDTKINVKKNDIIYLTTDGYIDQNAPNRKKIGTNRLIELLNKTIKLPMDVQKEELETFFNNYKHDEEQRDDIAILGLKF